MVRAMLRAVAIVLFWVVSVSFPQAARADEFAWELSANASRYELEPLLDTDRSSLGATYFFGGVDDGLGPYALASFLDPKTRIGVTAAREDQTSYPIGSGSQNLPPSERRTDRYSLAGRFVFPETKWYVGGGYERPDRPASANGLGLAMNEDMEEKAYSAVLGKYLGDATSIELGLRRSELRMEGDSFYCVVNLFCAIGGTLVAEQTTDDVALAAAHVRRFRALTYRLTGRVEQTSGDAVIHTSAFEIPLFDFQPVPRGPILGPITGTPIFGPIGPTTIPAQTSELDLGTFRVYSTSGELFPTTKLGVRVGYSRWDGDSSIDDAYDVGVTWFVRRDLGLGAWWQRQTNDVTATFRHAETLGLHIFGRL
jgi:hypothetical protein